MPTNNFKLFDEKKSNMMTDEDYAINQQRLNGVQSGVASSQLQNKTLYQTALMCYALAQLMAANGYDANDANAVSTFVNNLSSTMVQKIVDKASENEAKEGISDTKFMSPKSTRNSVQLTGTIDPTENTVGYICQIYTNTKTERAFVCVGISNSKYTWMKIPKKVTVVKTEIITESCDYVVPSSATSVDIRLFGAGGGYSIVSNAAGGGGGGYMAHGVFDNIAGKSFVVTIGGASGGQNGGATSFGNLLTANGGGMPVPFTDNAGNGGSGGGGGPEYNGYGVNGGNGDYGGGGGGCGSDRNGSNGGNGGNGGKYGGGGGAGGSSFDRQSVYAGTGGELGGNGGNGAYGVISAKNGSDGTNTVGMGLEFEGEGKGGNAGVNRSSNVAYPGGGGGGGYGGNGGNGGNIESDSLTNATAGGGGGGGYGGNGGNGARSSSTVSTPPGGGGGGYGGNGDDARMSGVFEAPGGGGGYGPNNYGKGGSHAFNTEELTISPKSGICIITVTSKEIE